jgi:hypothetical protein
MSNKDVTGRDVRIFLLNTFRSVGRKIQPVTRPVTKSKIFIVTQILKARYAMKGQAVPATLWTLAVIFDLCLSPILYPYNWTKKFLYNMVQGARPIKSLPTK